MFAKYYENPTTLSRVIAKNVGDVFFETHCRRLELEDNIVIVDIIGLSSTGVI